jgi:UPF0716 family protein affecting phage T7 exclusion
VPNTWYVVLRLGQGFVAGVLVGALWGLWTIRRRRAGSAAGERPGAAVSAG